MPFKKGKSGNQSGRPKGAVNKEKREFIEILNQYGGIEERVKKLIELGDGITCVKYEGNQEIIYEKAPDVHANVYLIDRVCGKPKQSMELSGTVRTIEDELADIEPIAATALAAPDGTKAVH